MNPLALHEFHQGLRAHFTEVGGNEVVDHYGDPLSEHRALRESAGVFDLSFRGRVCLVGADRQRFLNGQVTNDVARLNLGEGCYAALVTAKGKMVSDLNIYFLQNETLLDFEPGITSAISQRLEKYIIADDVQIMDVGSLYGLLSVQGPQAEAAIRGLDLGVPIPEGQMRITGATHATLGEIYLAHQARIGTIGFDLFAPINSLRAVADQLIAATQRVGGCVCGWKSFEIARVEAGIPRFGADMDETNLPPEAGLETRAISYTKGCYIGQEVIARIRTYGQVAKALRGLRLPATLKRPPQKGDKLFHQGKEVGFVTSAIWSPVLRTNIALAYVRREANQVGGELLLRIGGEEALTQIVELPFVR